MFEYDEPFKDFDIWESFSHWGMFKTGEIRWTGRLVVRKEWQVALCDNT